MSEDETCKVSDFGLLRELPEGDSIYHMSTVVPCPVRWMAPESFGDRVFSPASDVWSFGILQWEMFHPTEMPYHHLGNMELVAKVKSKWHIFIPLKKIIVCIACMVGYQWISLRGTTALPICGVKDYEGMLASCA